MIKRRCILLSYHYSYQLFCRKEWVRSSTPYPLGLTLKQIQDILRMDQPMDKDCFNMAVRIVACDEIQFLIEPPVHNMDLRFCVSYYNRIFIVTVMVLNLFFHLSRRYSMVENIHFGVLSQILRSWQHFFIAGLG
jgi:hypothetical protein